MNFTDEQYLAIRQAGDLVVAAGAGSGKTRVLVERYLRLLDEQVKDPLSAVESLVAITFTEKAAREMHARVRQAVEDRARDALPAERPLWEERRAAIEAARIGTIHSFCAALLRAHPVESRLDPGFRLLDEVESGLLIEESIATALHTAISRLALEGHTTQAVAESLPTLIEELGPGDLQAILAELLRGGGDLRTIVTGMPGDPHSLGKHWRSQAAVLQAQARNELLANLQWVRASARVCALASLAPAGDRIGEQVRAVNIWLENFGVELTDFTLINMLNLQGGSKKAWGSDESLAEARAALGVLRETYRSVADLLAPVIDDDLELRAASAADGLRQLYLLAQANYMQRKSARDLLDFNDLERLTRTLLENYPSVRERWQAELHAVLVDEFQDTNDDQRALIYALVGKEQLADGDPSLPEATRRPELFIVGDGKQSIYRFRGADVRVFSQVEHDIIATGGARVTLATSFRSHTALIEWINQVAAPIFARSHSPRPYEFPFAPLHAYRPRSPHTCCVELHLVSAEGGATQRRDAEATVLANRIKELVESAEPLVFEPMKGWRAASFDDIALLFQASNAFEHYEKALRVANIPFLTSAGRGYYGRKEIQDLVHLLRVLDDPADDLALVGVLRSPLFALDDGQILRLRFAERPTLWDALIEYAEHDGREQALLFARQVLSELYASRGRFSTVELLRAALVATGYLATISGLRDGDRRRANVEKLVAAARLSGGQGLRTFRDYLARLLQTEAREGEAPLEALGSVRLMTVHRSKGLEFPIVGLPDLGRSPPSFRASWLAAPDEGLALQLRDQAGEIQRPLAYRRMLHAERQMERAERERLLYVALTRAQDYLLLSGGVARSSGDDWLSRLLDALGSPWEAGGPPAGDLGAMRVYR